MPSALSPAPLSAVWPVPQTQVLARATAAPSAPVLYSAAALAPSAPAVPVTFARCTVHCVPHCTLSTVALAEAKVAAPPPWLRLQLTVEVTPVPLGKSLR